MNTSVTLSCLTISMFSICIWLHCESAGKQVRLWNLIWQKSQLKRCTKQDPGCWVLQQEMLGERQRRRQPRIISGLWPDKFNLFARCRQLCSVDVDLDLVLVLVWHGTGSLGYAIYFWNGRNGCKLPHWETRVLKMPANSKLLFIETVNFAPFYKLDNYNTHISFLTFLFHFRECH